MKVHEYQAKELLRQYGGGVIATAGLAWVVSGAAAGYAVALLGLAAMTGSFRAPPAGTFR